jgi:hypothetical protein
MMETKYLAAALLEFFERSPDLFVRCDRDGKENPEGEFWRTREPMSRAQTAGRKRS